MFSVIVCFLLFFFFFNLMCPGFFTLTLCDLKTFPVDRLVTFTRSGLTAIGCSCPQISTAEAGGNSLWSWRRSAWWHKCSTEGFFLLGLAPNKTGPTALYNCSGLWCLTCSFPYYLHLNWTPAVSLFFIPKHYCRPTPCLQKDVFRHVALVRWPAWHCKAGHRCNTAAWC